jgi:hypothetical protein
MKSKTKRFDKNDAIGIANSHSSPFYMNVDHSRIGLSIVHMNMQLVVDLIKPIMLGRNFVDSDSSYLCIDLTPFDAENMGVSRRHALMEIQDNRLVVTDQQSSNGTLVNSKSIEPLVPFLIMQGDLLTLGHLKVLVNLLSVG